MSDEPRTIREQASALLGDGTKFADSMSDADIRRYTVVELIDCDSDKPDSFIDAAFRTLSQGDPRVPQIARRARQQRLGLRQTQKISGLRQTPDWLQ